MTGLAWLAGLFTYQLAAMTAGLQEIVALMIVALVAGTIVFRRIRAHRRRKRAPEASVSPDEIGRP